jgi:hypothetical protein
MIAHGKRVSVVACHDPVTRYDCPSSLLRCDTPLPVLCLDCSMVARLEPLDCIDKTISSLKSYFSIPSSRIRTWFRECYFLPRYPTAKLPLAVHRLELTLSCT